MVQKQTRVQTVSVVNGGKRKQSDQGSYCLLAFEYYLYFF